MSKLFKEMRKEATITSIIYIVIGMVLFFVPKLSADIIIWAISLIILLFGISHLVTYFKYDNLGFNERLDLVIGAISIGTGIFIILNSNFIMSIIPFVIGVFLLIESISLIKQAFVLKEYDLKQFKISLTLGIILVIGGIYLLFNPIKVVTSLITFIGLLFICMGSFELWTNYHVQKYIQ